jgi:hypothetical protein
MGICCARTNLDGTYVDTPEMRLKYLQIVAPVGSTLASTTIGSVLNANMQSEKFVWLVRVQTPAGGGDGPVSITTGFGRPNAVTPITYSFSLGTAAMPMDPGAWCPVQLSGTLTGETITSQPYSGVVTVPIFDMAEPTPNVTVQLVLRQLQIDIANWSDATRTCIGWKSGRPFTYIPQGTLSGYIEVTTAKAGALNVSGIMTTLCGAIAGSLSDPAYCEQSQSAWMTPPDSICDPTTSICRVNQPCMSDVCDPATTCNAWHLIAHFAAGAVNITDTTCTP